MEMMVSKRAVRKKSVYDIKKIYNRAVIMGIFMIGSIFAFACVVELVRRNVISFGKNAVIWGDQADFVFYVLLVISVALFFIIRFLKQYYLQENIMFMPDDQQSSEAYQPSTGILNLLIVAVMTYAFCEAPAIFGFVLFFLMGANPFYFYTAHAHVIGLLCRLFPPIPSMGGLDAGTH